MSRDQTAEEQIIAEQLQEAWGALHRALECNHAEATIERAEAHIEELRNEQIKILANK